MEVLGRVENKKGYTLVELVVVIALIAIVLSVSIPSFKLVFNTAEKKELMEFRRDLIFARNKAVMENTVYTVRLFINENRYQIVRKDKKVIKDKELSSGINFGSNNIDNSIDFYPSGAPSKSGTIVLANKKNERIEITIIMTTGKINLKIVGK